MNALMESCRRWWWGRTTREHWMLMDMTVLVLAVLVWLLVLRPAWAWREAAADRRMQAETALAQVEAGVRRLSGGGAAARAPAGDIEPVVRQTAEAAGLTITTGMDATGGLGFRAASVSSARLFGWIDQLKTVHHLEVSRLAIVENADATLSVEGGFARP